MNDGMRIFRQTFGEVFGTDNIEANNTAARDASATDAPPLVETLDDVNDAEADRGAQIEQWRNDNALATHELRTRLAAYQQEGQQPQQRPPAPVPQPRPTPTPSPQQPNVPANQPPQAQRPEAVQSVAPAQNNGEFSPVTTQQVRAIMFEGVPSRLRAEFNRNLEDYTNRLNDVMREFNINTPARQAAFLATVGLETGGLSLMTEGPSRHASSRSRWRGRGIIQLTGEPNYLRAGQYLRLGSPDTRPPYRELRDNPDLAATRENSFRIAGWFWSVREHPFGIPNNVMGEQPRADLRDFREASSLVNSGRPDGPINGWADRLVFYERALNALNVEVDQQTTDNIRQGQRGRRNLRGEPSYYEWQREQRARRRRRGGRDD